MVQETYETHPPYVRPASGTSAPTRRHAPRASWSPESLALYTQAVIQGAFVLAKAKHGPQVADECIAHLRRYLEPLFDQPGAKE